MYKFFFQHFLRNPKNVGAIVPLSQSVATQLVKHLDMRTDDTPWKILEVGAGAGNISHSIVSRMKEHDSFDIIEIDSKCCDLLTSKFYKDKRVAVNCMSIMDWYPGYHYDLIVSTLPLNSFAPELVANVFSHYQNLGNKDAICTYVEYIGLEKLKTIFVNEEARKTMIERRRIINTFLKNHLLEKNKVFANFLPCYVYHIKLHPSLLAR